jgi:MOSC domain-containing protein YiiM
MWIGLRAVRLAPVAVVTRAEVLADGLAGDHGRAGARAVTLLQWEHLAVLASLLGQPVAPETLRRNIAVAGLNLSALRGAQVRVGGGLLRVTGPCAPCSRMEAALGRGGWTALRGHGGWCAEVVTPGMIALGDTVSAG